MRPLFSEHSGLILSLDSVNHVSPLKTTDSTSGTGSRRPGFPAVWVVPERNVRRGRERGSPVPVSYTHLDVYKRQ